MEKGIILCPFHTLHQHLEPLHFPPKKAFHMYSTRQRFLLQESRRNAFNSFLEALQWNFSQFPSETLDEAIQHGACGIANACLEFLNMHIYIAEMMRTQGNIQKARGPLQLTSWWVEREHHARYKEAHNEETHPESIPVKTSHNDSVTIREMVLERDIEKTMYVYENLMRPLQQMQSLPTLKIQPMQIDSPQNVLEEYCNHLLQQYGHHIEELEVPELSEQRRWELTLYVACWVGHIYAVRMILFYRSNPNVSIGDGTTCLHVAARMGHSSVLSVLLQEGAYVDAQNNVGVTSLVAACRHGKYEAARLLLEAGADSSIASLRGTYPLHAAIVAKCADLVRLLIFHGAEVNVVTSNGITPLHFAAKLGSTAICRLLLQHHADVHRSSINGDTALTVAKMNGYSGVCSMLQQYSLHDPLQRAKISIWNVTEENHFGSI